MIKKTKTSLAKKTGRKERIKRKIQLIKEKIKASKGQNVEVIVINKKYKDYFYRGTWKLPGALTKVEEGTRLKEKSGHGAFPTYAMKNTETRKEPSEIQITGGAPLVVKPYTFKDPNAKKIRTEFENTLKAYEYKISNVEPIGIVVDQKTKTGYIYTLANTAGVPLSRIRYNILPEKRRSMILTEMARQMRGWHDKGFLHNDAKLKNFLYDNIQSRIKIHPNELEKPDREILQMRIGEHGKTKSKEKIRIEPIDLENSKFLTKSASPRDRGFDLAMFVGDAIYHGMIKSKKDLKTFLESYDPGNSEFWVQELKSRVKEHKRDSVIQNIKRILK